MVVSDAGLRVVGGRPRHFWACKCDCGARCDVVGENLRSGNSASCGCRKRNALGDLTRTHGEANAIRGVSPEYRAWQNMKKRCYNPADKRWARYGARGIKVCSEWRDSYEAFLRDMGRRPSPKHSLERLDNDGDYAPGNVAWETAATQARNKSTSRKLSLDGRTMTLSDWAKEFRIRRTTLAQRLSAGWTLREALTRPVS